MVLPTPLGPRSKTLCPLATKPRVQTSSTMSRGMARGWFQSKRSRGLKLPMAAALVRAARFRWSQLGEQPGGVRRHPPEDALEEVAVAGEDARERVCQLVRRV